MGDRTSSPLFIYLIFFFFSYDCLFFRLSFMKLFGALGMGCWVVQILHRDIKAADVLLTEKLAAKVQHLALHHSTLQNCTVQYSMDVTRP